MSKCSCNCDCDKGTNLIFSCSGASDTGEIADQATRKISRGGLGRMACLAGIGGQVKGIVLSAEAADTVLAIDGCPQNCAKKSLELAGIRNIRHIQLADLGLSKGNSEVNELHIDIVSTKGEEILKEVCS